MSLKLLIHGMGGRMGQEVARLAQSGFRDSIAVAGVDPHTVTGEIPCYPTLDEVTQTPDCIVDFSHHTATVPLLRYACAHRLPVVVATTGQTPDELDAIREAAREIPVFHSANMSLGVALLLDLARTAVLAMPDADIEIIEKHHNRKLDAPSGTALMIAHALQKVREGATLLLGRSGQGKRTKDEIGIHAVRMGNIIGEHEVLIGTDSQTITLKHEAHSRALFAEGAVTAAAFLVGQPAGLYDMDTLLARAKAQG